MLLGFKRQFAPFVEEGSKTHTIRAKRRIAPRSGELCHCYTGLRQKAARLLGRWPCVRVEDIKIEKADDPACLAVTINGEALSADEVEAFLYKDGFRGNGGEIYPATAQARAFWGDRLPFEGQIIHWDYSRPVAGGVR